MTPRTAEASPQIYARVAGFLYLLLGALAFFGLPAHWIMPGAVATVARSIMASETEFRLRILSNLLVGILNVFVVLALYQLLKPVSKSMASLMVIFNLLGVAISMLNEVNRVAALLLVSGAGYTTGFTANQVHALVLFFLELWLYGFLIAALFWGLWLFPMGYLVFKSGFIPRVLGILLMIGCFGYLINSFAVFLAIPNYQLNIVIFTGVGEVLFPLWLLIRGVNVERWQKRAREAA